MSRNALFPVIGVKFSSQAHLTTATTDACNHSDTLSARNYTREERGKRKGRREGEVGCKGYL